MNATLAIALTLVAQCPGATDYRVPRIETALVEVVGEPVVHPTWDLETPQLRQEVEVLASTEGPSRGQRRTIRMKSYPELPDTSLYRPSRVFERRDLIYRRHAAAYAKCRLPVDATGQRFVVALAESDRLFDWWPAAEPFDPRESHVSAPQHGMGGDDPNAKEWRPTWAVVEVRAPGSWPGTGVPVAGWVGVIVRHHISGPRGRGDTIWAGCIGACPFASWCEHLAEDYPERPSHDELLGTARPGAWFLVEAKDFGSWDLRFNVATPVPRGYDPWADHQCDRVAARLDDPTMIFQARPAATPRKDVVSGEGSAG